MKLTSNLPQRDVHPNELKWALMMNRFADIRDQIEKIEELMCLPVMKSKYHYDKMKDEIVEHEKAGEHYMMSPEYNYDGFRDYPVKDFNNIVSDIERFLTSVIDQVKSFTNDR